MQPVKTDDEINGSTLYECPKCEDYRGRKERCQAHMADCKGYSKPRKRFLKGDKVKLSALGQMSIGRKFDNPTWEIVGFLPEDSYLDHCVEVERSGYGSYGRDVTRFASVYLKNINRDPPVEEEQHVVKEL